jgi:hypothetical protein
MSISLIGKPVQTSMAGSSGTTQEGEKTFTVWVADKSVILGEAEAKKLRDYLNTNFADSSPEKTPA